MPDPFRSEQEALRNRADQLERVNEELRAELARLESERGPTARSATGPPSARSRALVELSEKTLARLETDLEAETAPSPADDHTASSEEHRPEESAPQTPERSTSDDAPVKTLAAPAAHRNPPKRAGGRSRGRRSSSALSHAQLPPTPAHLALLPSAALSPSAPSRREIIAFVVGLLLGLLLAFGVMGGAR